MIAGLGHRVRIVNEYESEDCDLLIALHARKSAPSLRNFRERFPSKPAIVALTGTDIYGSGIRDSVVRTSLNQADQIVVLQSAAVDSLPPAHRKKTRVIHQSVAASHDRRPAKSTTRRVIVAGHLRSVKDPLRAAYAVRRMPPASKILVEHYGAIIDPPLERKVRLEEEKNTRYRYRGEVTRSRLRRLFCHSWLMVLSSKLEGGANVLGESVAVGLPVIATRIPGSEGLLGADYPGYFDVGQTGQLTHLLSRAETDPKFYRQLEVATQKRQYLFEPRREQKAWKSLLEKLL